MENILDNFVLPTHLEAAGVRDDVARLQFQDQGDGISVMSGFDRGISYRFKMVEVHNEKKSQEAGVEIYDEEECIEFNVSSKTKPCYQIKFLDPERLRFNRKGEPVGGLYFEAYKRWKENKATPGLSLDKWPEVNIGMVRTFNSEGIFSVEQLAQLPEDAILDKFRKADVFIEAWKKAIKYVSNFDSGAKSKEQVDKLLVKMEEQKNMFETAMAQATSRIEQLQAQIEAGNNVSKAPSYKRGKVKKDN